MGIAVIIGLLIVGIVLFEAHRRGRLHNDRLQALVNITAIIGVLAAVIQFVVPLATEDEPTPTLTPSIEIAIPSSETPVPATQTPAPATEAPIAPTSGPIHTGTNTPIPTLTLAPTPTLSPTLPKTPAPTVPIPAGVQVVATRVAEEDGMIQVYVPEEQFLMGSVPGDEGAEDNEIPQRNVIVTSRSGFLARQRWNELNTWLAEGPSEWPAEWESEQLDELLAGISEDNLHKEIDFGPPVGAEVW